MIQTTITSDANENLRSGDLFRIVTSSSINNHVSNLTGFLVYSGSRFFQLLEGSQEKIDELLIKLERDPHHSNITVTSRSEISQRSFRRWKMKRTREGAFSSKVGDYFPELANAPAEIVSAVIDFLNELSAEEERPVLSMEVG